MAITWWPFDVFIGLVIIANSATIGVESSLTVDGRPLPLWLRVLEKTFLAIYLAELALRLAAGGMRLLRENRWVLFDATLVSWGVVDFIAGLMPMSSAVGYTVVRIMRIGRLARLIRLGSGVPRSLLLLVNGLFHSCAVLVWTLLTASVVTYIFAVAGMEFIRSKSDPSEIYDLIARDSFGTLPRSMLTLLQAFTLDSIGAVYRPLALENPSVIVFFLAYIFLASIALMNLVTAVIVDTAIQQASESREHQNDIRRKARLEMISTLRALFNDLDGDQSGNVNIAEVRHAPPEVLAQLESIVQMSNIEQLFEYLDSDGSGQLGVEEFVEGILKSESGTPIELLCIMKQCRTLIRNCKLIMGDLDRISTMTTTQNLVCYRATYV